MAPAVIQPAGLFLDVVGEELRARTYVFTDPDGEELCLRPDLTVPTCRLHLGAPPGRQRAGALLLQRLGLPLSAGRRRRAPTRASSARPASSRSPPPTASRTTPPCSPLIVEALRDAGSRALQLRIGDLGLFNALLDALPMPERWRRRLHASVLAARGLPRRAGAAHLAEALASRRACRATLSTGSIRPIPQDAAGLVGDYLDQSGIELIGTRSLAEIAERLLAEVADARETPLARETRGADRELRRRAGRRPATRPRQHRGR